MQGPAAAPASSKLNILITLHNINMGGEQRIIPTSSDYPKLAAGPVGKQIDRIYRDRLRQFTDGGQYYWQGLLPYVATTSILFQLHTETT